MELLWRLMLLFVLTIILVSRSMAGDLLSLLPPNHLPAFGLLMNNAQSTNWAGVAELHRFVAVDWLNHPGRKLLLPPSGGTYQAAHWS